MTLSTLISRVSYPGTGSAGPFAYPFPIQLNREDDLLVTKRSSGGVETTLVRTTDYTVQGAGSATGTVTLIVALAVGETIFIRRKPPLNQPASVRNQGPFFGSTIEDEFDRLAMQIQSVQDGLDRCVKLKESINPIASLLELEPTTGFVVTGTGSGFQMQALAASSNVVLPGSGRATATLTAYLANNAVFNPMDYPNANGVTAAGNGNTDDTVAVAAAIAAWKASVIAQTGGCLYVTHPHRVKNADMAGMNGAVALFAGGAFWGMAAGTVGTGTVTAVAGAFTFSVSQAGILSVGLNITVAGLNYRIVTFNGTTGATVVGPPENYVPTFGAAAFTINPDAVLSIRNSTGMTLAGAVDIAGAYNLGYGAGIAIYTDNATSCSIINIHQPSIASVRCAYRIGRPTEPGPLVSEINLVGGYTYGCPTVCEAYGTQTVASFIGSDLLANDFGGGAPWIALTQYTVRVFGSWVSITGGEAQHPETSTGACFCIEPITDAVNGNYYGTVYCSNCEVEAASRIGLAQNSLGVAVPIAGSGWLNLQGCFGYHALNTFPFIDMSVASFTGRVTVGGGSYFFAGVARSFANVNCAGLANVYVDDEAFGLNFVQGLQGLVGGIIHFTHRQILSVNNTAAQAVGGVVKFGSVVVTNDSAGRFNNGYSAATGVFTAPQALKNVTLTMSLRCTNPATMDLAVDVYLAGALHSSFPVLYRNAGAVNGVSSGSLQLGDVASGTTIELRATAIGAASNFNSALLEKMVLAAAA